jgi:benzodiazapine receptor
MNDRKNMIKRILIFLLLNFAALAIGAIFTNQAVKGEWYLSLNKAPWTPPGWVFGAAWGTIMICFSFYMAWLWTEAKSKQVLVMLYVVQWIFNVAWNPVFFYWHQVAFGLIIIAFLLVVVGWMLVKYWPTLRWRSALIVPYVLWLMIATRLNLYIMINNF